MRVSSQNYFDNIINNLCTALSKENEVVLVGTLSKEEKEPDTEPGTFNLEEALREYHRRSEKKALMDYRESVDKALKEYRESAKRELREYYTRYARTVLREYMERGTLSEAKAVGREYKIKMDCLSIRTILEDSAEDLAEDSA
jgi:hypothetical protein